MLPPETPDGATFDAEAFKRLHPSLEPVYGGAAEHLIGPPGMLDKYLRLRADLDEALEAIRLTQEYTQLPAHEGWTWFDVYRKHRPEAAHLLQLRQVEATTSTCSACQTSQPEETRDAEAPPGRDAEEEYQTEVGSVRQPGGAEPEDWDAVKPRLAAGDVTTVNAPHRDAEITRLMDALEAAWGLIANAAYWDLTDPKRHLEWDVAQARWRDNHYHPALARHRHAAAAFQGFLMTNPTVREAQRKARDLGLRLHFDVEHPSEETP